MILPKARSLSGEMSLSPRSSDDMLEDGELAERHEPLNRISHLEQVPMLEVTAAHYIDQFLYRRMVEQSHAPEPASTPVSNGKSSPPAR